MKLSTTLKTAIANAWIPSIGYDIYIYSGTIPDTGNNEPTGTLLVTLNSGTIAVTAGTGTIAATDFVGVAVATGTAGYAMMTAGGTASADRIYFTVGTSATELIISSTSIVVNDNISGTFSMVVAA